MPSLVRAATRLTLDLLFPPQCALCGAGGTLLCELCIAMLPLADGQRCDRCWIPLRSGNTCGHCLQSPPSFVSVRAACVMDANARELVHRLKYDGLSAMGEPMAALMLAEADAVSAGGTVVVPVPLHRGRERSRGYNQSQLLAAPLARALELPLDARALRRTRATAPLAKAMDRDERRRIVAGAFAANPTRAARQHVLLIDDVTTTGATLDACAAALLDAGAASVRCLTFARAD
jgi:ComF family protein